MQVVLVVAVVAEDTTEAAVDNCLKQVSSKKVNM